MLIEAMAIAMTARVGREQILMLSFIRYLQVGKWETTVSIHQNAALEIFLNVLSFPLFFVFQPDGIMPPISAHAEC